jgi:hypothetical protein
MRFAYADPPYLGLGGYYAKYHPQAHDWNDPETHRRLIERLCDEFPDGWAMSLHTPSLRHILPMCPTDARVLAWVKPFASFKPGQTIAYAWEPVIFRGGRPKERTESTRRDWLAENMTMKKGLVGAKPERFCRWIFTVLNARPGDHLEDLFPGSGVVTVAWEKWITSNANDNDDLGGIRKDKK